MVGPPPEWSHDLEILVANDIRDARRPLDPSAARANTGALLRLGWMLGGNALLLILALVISMERPWTITVRDGLFWLAVAATIVMRYADVTHYGGQTATGEPATRAHLRRFAVVMPVICAVLWSVAQSVQIVGSSTP